MWFLNYFHLRQEVLANQTCPLTDWQIDWKDSCHLRMETVEALETCGHHIWNDKEVTLFFFFFFTLLCQDFFFWIFDAVCLLQFCEILTFKAVVLYIFIQQRLAKNPKFFVGQRPGFFTIELAIFFTLHPTLIILTHAFVKEHPLKYLNIEWKTRCHSRTLSASTHFGTRIQSHYEPWALSRDTCGRWSQSAQ